MGTSVLCQSVCGTSASAASTGDERRRCVPLKVCLVSCPLLMAV